MANVAIVRSATVQDGLGRRKVTESYGNIVDTTTLAQLAAAQGTWITDLDGIIDGAIIFNRVTIKPALPGGIKVVGTGATFLASRVSQIGIFRFSATGTSRAWSSDVPSVADALIVGGSINTGAAAVGTYTTLLTSGPFTNPENQALVALEKALLSFRKSKP